ncbi:hypothetical protein ACFV90_35705 [Streptomyces sp. NPDC059904]|uniref:hypothetical protein n=1 Tax=Streptomyces sp. NPDC059904 TaxID=3346996 RepID=UPI0036464A29
MAQRSSTLAMEAKVNDFNEPVRVNVADGEIALQAKANATAVSGVSTDGFGVEGRAHGTGVVGVSEAWLGVYGESTGGLAVDAVRGQGKGETCGVAGHSEQGIGVYGRGGALAAKFDGRVKASSSVECQFVEATHGHFTGNVRADHGDFFAGMSAGAGAFSGEVTAKKFRPIGADYAETFAAGDEFEPGTVLVIGDDGLMAPCDAQYDSRATGVVSGAGGLTPGTVMESNPDSAHHVTLALAGQVYVKADPQYGPIAAGDLLTTSPSEGCAMRVSDRGRAVGAILGKALAPLDGPPGLLRMLVTPS